MADLINFEGNNSEKRCSRHLMESYIDGRRSGMIEALHMAYHIYLEWMQNDDDTPYEEILEDMMGDLLSGGDFDYEDDEE